MPALLNFMVFQKLPMIEVPTETIKCVAIFVAPYFLPNLRGKDSFNVKHSWSLSSLKSDIQLS